MKFKSIVTFVVALAVCVVAFLVIDMLLFKAQGLSLRFKG